MTDPENLRWSRTLPAGAIWVALLFLLLCGMIVGNFWILGWEPTPPEPVPVRFEPEPCDGSCLPPSLAARAGPQALERLSALANRRALTETRSPNPLAGQPLKPTALGSLPKADGPQLPQAMLDRLCEAVEVEDGGALGQRLIRRAEQSVRDPEGELEARTWLRPHLRDQVLRGASWQLERTARALVEAPPIHRRPTVVIRGQARQVSTYVIGHEQAAEREAATFDAWAAIAEDVLAAERFELDLERGRYLEVDDPLSRSVGVERTWVEGWFDWAGWFEDVQRGREPAGRPFFELGRLQALQLMNEAGLVEIVFLGHGIEVDSEAHGDGRYQPFAMAPVSIGDEHQEVLALRAKRDGFTLRYGLTLDARAPFWAASCSNRQGGETRPDQSTAALAFLVANGHYPDAASLDPFVFGVYRQLQAALLEAEGPQAAAQAVQAAVREEAGRFEAQGELRAVLTLGPSLWLLRVGGSESPDLLLIGDPAWEPSADDALRITLATSGWRRLEPLPGSGELQLTDPWDPCASPEACRDTLDDLLPQARRYASGGKPPADDSTPYRLRRLLKDRWVQPDPDASNRFLRLAWLEQGEPDPDAMQAVEDALKDRFAEARARRRVQGWVLAMPEG